MADVDGVNLTFTRAVHAVLLSRGSPALKRSSRLLSVLFDRTSAAQLRKRSLNLGTPAAQVLQCLCYWACRTFLFTQPAGELAKSLAPLRMLVRSRNKPRYTSEGAIRAGFDIGSASRICSMCMALFLY
jgi:hypothetical protein